MTDTDMIVDRDFAPYDYTDAKVNSVFLNMYNWVRPPLRMDDDEADGMLGHRSNQIRHYRRSIRPGINRVYLLAIQPSRHQRIPSGER